MLFVIVQIPRTSMGNRIAVISTTENRVDESDDAIPHLGIDPEEMKSMCQRDISIPMVGTALFMITGIYSVFFLLL